MNQKQYIGIALDNLMDDTTTSLRVWIPELSPFTTEDPADETSVTTKATNFAPNTKAKFDLTAVSYVVCEFYNNNSNFSRPNIHKGEQVEVYVFEENGEYFWDSIGRDDKLRTTEHVKIRIANKKSQLDPLDDDHSYFIEIDSRKGLRKIQFHTSKGTDEAVAYDLVFDIENSMFGVQDSVGNSIVLDSLAGILTQTLVTSLDVVTPNTNFSGNITAVGEIKTLLNSGVKLSTHKHLGTGNDADINMTSPSPAS